MHEFRMSLKRIRGWPWLVCAAAVGILLMLFSGESSSENEHESYLTAVEHKIAQMTETLPGVEDVSVLVTTEEEGRDVFSVYGDTGGRERICGIAVTCIGGSDARIRLQILDMLCAAFDLTADRVWVGGKKAYDGP